MEQPTLFYSGKDKGSEIVFNTYLNNLPEILSQIRFVNVETEKQLVPSYIKVVPTLILDKKLLSGDTLFRFFGELLSKKQMPEMMIKEQFNPNSQGQRQRQMTQDEFEQMNKQMNPQHRNQQSNDVQYNPNQYTQPVDNRYANGLPQQIVQKQGITQQQQDLQYKPMNSNYNPNTQTPPNFQQQGIPTNLTQMEQSMSISEGITGFNCSELDGCAPISILQGVMHNNMKQMHIPPSIDSDDGKHFTIKELSEAPSTLQNLQ